MIINLILFIVILGIVVLVHEFGHFIFSKIFGVKVYEFSIGMGPKLFQKEAKDGTKYSIRWIPIGGFVSLAGEDEQTDNGENLKKGESLNDKPIWQKIIIMFMGVGNNFILAFLVLFLSGLIFGSTSLKPVVTATEDGYPAANAGIEAGDEIVKINNHKVTYTDDISLYFTIEDLENNVNIEVKKTSGEIKNYSVKPEKNTAENGSESYVIGISFAGEVEKGLIPSLSYAVNKEGAIFKQMFVVLGSLFTGKLSVNELSGPVGIYSVVGTMRTYGIDALLYLIALLCINVGVINILPFPAFDGGRIFLLLIEKISGKKIPLKIENAINSVGFILLIILMIYVTFNDILRLF